MTDWALVADDHPLMQQGLALALGKAFPGCPVVTAGTALEATLEVARRGHCSLILLDFQLPDSRGYSAFLHLQDLAPATPIVIVTAREDRSLIEAAKALDAAGYILKSAPLDTIVEILRGILAGSRHFPQ